MRRDPNRYAPPNYGDDFAAGYRSDMRLDTLCEGVASLNDLLEKK